MKNSEYLEHTARGHAASNDAERFPSAVGGHEALIMLHPHRANFFTASGSLPRRQRRLVEAWAELHQAELLTDLQLLKQGKKASANQTTGIGSKL